MIGSCLRDTDTKLRHCYACRTEAATNVSFEPSSNLTPAKLVNIYGTRCDACGDVRLFQLLNDGTTDPAIREELDVLAMMLTEACLEEIDRAQR